MKKYESYEICSICKNNYGDHNALDDRCPIRGNDSKIIGFTARRFSNDNKEEVKFEIERLASEYLKSKEFEICHGRIDNRSELFTMGIMGFVNYARIK